MSGAGRRPTVTDEEVIREIALVSGPVAVSSELTDRLGMSRQGVDKRLRDLEDRGLLESKIAGRTRIWWISKKGWDVLESARSSKSNRNDDA
jgi:CTP-dependent riboflavin kinase